jgi:tetratricopeptide (TPR) repeat protein
MPSPTLSACLIVRDEATMLPGCLESLQGVADEVVVVDTGSRDRTVEIARSYGARVLHHPWQDDFAAPRNAAFEAATGNWWLVIDADERLHRSPAAPGGARPLAERLEAGGCRAYTLRIANFEDLAGRRLLDAFPQARLFRRSPRLRYSGRIHEGVTLPPGSRVGHLPDLELHHFGYVPAVVAARGKIERNMTQLRQELAERPHVPSLHFYIAREYHRAGDLPQAEAAYRAALRLLAGRRPPYWGELTMRFVQVLVQLERLDEALAHCRTLLREAPMFATIWLLQGSVLRMRGRATEALGSLYRALAYEEPAARAYPRLGILPAWAWVEIGLCYERLGDLPKAVAAYGESLRCTPTMPVAVERLLGLLLSHGERPEAVHRHLTATAPADDPAIAAAAARTFAAFGLQALAAAWADGCGQPGAAAHPEPAARASASG